MFLPWVSGLAYLDIRRSWHGVLPGIVDRGHGVWLGVMFDTDAWSPCPVIQEGAVGGLGGGIGLVDVTLGDDPGGGGPFGKEMPFDGGVEVVIVRVSARGGDLSASEVNLGRSRVGMMFIPGVDGFDLDDCVVMSGEVGGVVRIWAKWDESMLRRAFHWPGKSSVGMWIGRFPR